MITALVLVGGVGAFLLWNQGEQARGALAVEATDRVGVAQQLIDHVAAPELAFAAEDLAGQPQLRVALAGADPGGGVNALLNGHGAIQIPSTNMAVFDARGRAVASITVLSAPALTSALPSLQLTAFGPGGGKVPAASGIEQLDATTAAYDTAIAVRGSDGSLLGCVVYSSPMAGLMARYSGVIGSFDVVTVTASTAATRFSPSGVAAAAVLPPAIGADVLSHLGTVKAAAWIPADYSTPKGEVVAGYMPLTAPDGGVAGAIGVEVPLAALAAQSNSGQQGIVLMALTAALLMSLAVILFADRYLRRPIVQLERSVARIAAGDYDTPLPATGDDEIGRLARGIDAMRAAIAGHMHRRDASDLQLREVSRALTATTSGTDVLRRAVIDAARAIAGGEARADVVMQRDDGLTSGAGAADLLTDEVRKTVFAGTAVETRNDDGHLLAVPMPFQDRVTGALIVRAPQALTPSQVHAISTLANNGGIALSNTRVYEQEREALRVFRELHTMKSDFLAIAQHELRTPVQAILGYLELLGMTWSQWDEEQRTLALRDIEVSTRQLAAMVENIVHFSLLGNDLGTLRRAPVGVRAAIERVIEEITRVYRAGLPVTISIACPDDLAVLAVAEQFDLALRALLDNAVKFSAAGGSVRVAAAADSDGGLVRIDVIDDGVGIPESELSRIFDRFYQTEASMNRVHSGMGLGLAVVRRLCEEHDASVSVRSEPSSGSCFTLLWPAALDQSPS